MYNTFECHFKPNQKYQSNMDDPVATPLYKREAVEKLKEVILEKMQNEDLVDTMSGSHFNPRTDNMNGLFQPHTY